jgi:hypothetical protein
MVAMTLLAVLAVAGSTFYVKFLIELSKEYRHGWIAYLVRLRPDSEEYTVLEPRELRTSISRAA